MIETDVTSAVVIGAFVFTYVGMALGRVPGLRLERTGIALVAVAVLLVFGDIDLGFVGQAQDASTLVLLFALMILSAQLASSGFYDVCAQRITLTDAGPHTLLAVTVLTSGMLSAILTNDIVVFAMTPLLCQGLRARGLDPRPFLVGLAGGSNAGSAATLIGNPQNILIGEVGGLDFWHYLSVCGPPSVAALAIVFVIISLVWRHELAGPGVPPSATDELSKVDRWQTSKGLLIVIALVALFATSVPRAVSALGLVALLLAGRRFGSRSLLAAVDWHLLLLFACLFTVTAAFSATGLAEEAMARLAEYGLLPENLSVMVPLTLMLSNSIGNVPAVILLTTVWPEASIGALYALALLSTLAGNLLLIGSLANLIVAERAKSTGVILGFGDFAKAGVPMTLLSMALAAGWLAATGLMPWATG